MMKSLIDVDFIALYDGCAVEDRQGRVGTLVLSGRYVSVGYGSGRQEERFTEEAGWELLQCDTCERYILRAPESISSGYGSDQEGHHYCYECCAEEDRQIMREQGKHYLYLVEKDGRYELHNWPGSLVIKNVQVTSQQGIRKARHITRNMYVAFSFWFENTHWYGRCQGDQQSCWVKRYK